MPIVQSASHEPRDWDYKDAGKVAMKALKIQRRGQSGGMSFGLYFSLLTQLCGALSRTIAEVRRLEWSGVSMRGSYQIDGGEPCEMSQIAIGVFELIKKAQRTPIDGQPIFSWSLSEHEFWQEWRRLRVYAGLPVLTHFQIEKELNRVSTELEIAREDGRKDDAVRLSREHAHLEVALSIAELEEAKSEKDLEELRGAGERNSKP